MEKLPQNLEPYDNLKKYIIKANPNNSIFEEVNNFNQTSKPEIDENILLYFNSLSDDGFVTSRNIRVYFHLFLVLMFG